MPKSKKVSSKKTDSKKFSLNDLKNKSNQHFHFIVVLVLFSAFSMFSMVSFFISNSDYLDVMSASVLDADGGNDNGSDDNISDDNVSDDNVSDDNVSDDNVSDDNVSDDNVSNTNAFRERYEIFSDLYSDDDGADAVEKLYELGVIHGYPDGSFKPSNSINRAELLTILTNAVDADLAGLTLDSCFVDVKNEWFAPFVCYAKVSNWVKGYEDGSYKPANPVIRAEALKIVLESFDFEIPDALESPYADVDPSDWYAGYALFAKDAGILGERQFFNAIEEIDRAEFIKMVHEAMGYKGLF